MDWCPRVMVKLWSMEDSNMLGHFSKWFLCWKQLILPFFQSSIKLKWQYFAIKVYSNGDQFKQLVLKSSTSHKKPIIWDAKYHICKGIIENLHPLRAFYFVAALKFPPCTFTVLQVKVARSSLRMLNFAELSSWVILAKLLWI